MMSVGEHIYRLYAQHLVLHIKQAEVAGLRGGVTAHVNDALGLSEKDGIDNIIMHAGTRGVSDNDIGTTILVDEFLVENILHVASKEKGVIDAIDG